jgi:phosphate-selective porin
MNFKRNILLTGVASALAFSTVTAQDTTRVASDTLTKVVPSISEETIPLVSKQEPTEAPLDTLTRAFQSLSDDVAKMKRLKITGYIQPQWQYTDSAGAPSVAGGDFFNGKSPYTNRFMMRRGRFKFTYDFQNTRVMINTDVTEKGLAMRETYVKITDPWLKMFSLTAGLLQDQFGFELNQSSSERETPERARMNQTLFPTERDLGVFGTAVFPKSSPLYGLKLDAAVMNGSAGVAPEFDSYKDYTGRVQYSRTTRSEKIAYALGGSYYTGGYRIGSVKDYNASTLASGNQGFVFATDTANYNRKAKRNYVGADMQLTFDWKPGITILRAEYIQGLQPGTDVSSRSVGGPPTAAIYNRAFNGAYFYFIQDIGETKFQVVAKYDWYDPNTKISGKEIGKTGTNTKLGDIKFETYGVGITYRMNANVKIMTYYDFVHNEATAVKGYTRDIKDDVLTIRMQYKF